MTNKHVIYVLIDPRDDAIRYVGVTKQSLDKRLADHVRDVKKDNCRSARALWIRELLDMGVKPRMERIETITASERKERELFWMEEFRRRGCDLVNTAPATGAETKSWCIEWTPELDMRLGTVSDIVLARELGVTRKAITYRRRKLGISALNRRPSGLTYRPFQKRAVIPEHLLPLLGKMPDQKLAEKAGVSKKTVLRWRKARGIPSWGETNDHPTRFTSGMPHPCWQTDAYLEQMNKWEEKNPKDGRDQTTA